MAKQLRRPALSSYTCNVMVQMALRACEQSLSRLPVVEVSLYLEGLESHDNFSAKDAPHSILSVQTLPQQRPITSLSSMMVNLQYE